MPNHPHRSKLLPTQELIDGLADLLARARVNEDPEAERILAAAHRYFTLQRNVEQDGEAYRCLLISLPGDVTVDSVFGVLRDFAATEKLDCLHSPRDPLSIYFRKRMGTHT